MKGLDRPHVLANVVEELVSRGPVANDDAIAPAQYGSTVFVGIARCDSNPSAIRAAR